MPPIYHGSVPFALKRGSQALNLYYGSTLISGAGGGGLVPVPAAAPVIVTGTFTGNGTSQSINLGYRPDFVLVKANAATEAVKSSEGSWYLRTDYLANATGSLSTGITITNTGFSVGALADCNANAVTMHYVAVRDNDHGSLLATSYQGNATAGRTVDILTGKNPKSIIIKRDGVRLAMYGALGKSTVNVLGDVAYAGRVVVNADGTLTLDASVETNEWSGASGEGMATEAFFDTDHCATVNYTGNATAGRTVSLPFEPCWLMIVPHGPTTTAFSGLMWHDTLTAGQHIPLGAGAVTTGRITSVVGTTVTLPAHDSTNKNATNFTLIALKKNVAVTNPFAITTAKYNKEVQLTAGYIDCGTSDTLKIDGAITLEWLGSITPSNTTAFAGGAGVNDEAGKQYPIFCRSAGADNICSAGGAVANTSFALAALNAVPSTDWVGSVITLASHNFWGVPDTLPMSPGLDYFPFYTGYRIDQGNLVHVQATHDGLGNWVVYVNGRPQKERKRNIETVLGGTYPAVKNSQGGTGHRTVFGARYRTGGTPSHAHAMKMRMARVYGRALTAAEALQNFRSVLNMANPVTGYVEEWDARNAVGASLPATVNSANNGTIVNGSVVSL